MSLTPEHAAYVKHVATHKPSKEEQKAAKAREIPRLGKDSLPLSPFLLKSALFSAVSHGPRVLYPTFVELAAYPGYKVEFRGEELRQDDRMVLLSLIKARADARAKEPTVTAIDVSFTFVPRTFCVKYLGWPDSGESTKKLEACLTRLQGASVRLYGERFGTHLYSFVSDAVMSPGEWRVWLSPLLATMFSRPVTYLKHSIVAGAFGLDSWIYGYVAADRCVDDDGISREHLRKLCGLTGYSQKEFNRRLKLALEKLQALGVITGFKSSGDRLDNYKASIVDPEVLI